MSLAHRVEDLLAMIPERLGQPAYSFLRPVVVWAQRAVKGFVEPRAGFGHVWFVAGKDPTGVLVPKRDSFRFVEDSREIYILTYRALFAISVIR